MEKVAKRIFAIILSLSMVFTIILNSNIAIVHGENSNVNIQNSLKMNRKKAVIGNNIVLVVEDENLTVGNLKYKNPSGEIIEVEPHYEEDANFYYYAIETDAVGEWSFEEITVNGNAVDLSNFDYKFMVYENLKEMTGNQNSYISTENLESSYNNIAELLSDIYAIDSKGEYIEYNIKILNQTFSAINYGIGAESITEIPNIEPGNYNILISALGNQVEKNINLKDNLNEDSGFNLPEEAENNEDVSKLSANLSDIGKIIRLSGKNRSQTAVKISKQQYPNGGVSNVILVTGDNYPDALAVSSLASKNNAPILYVEAKKLDEATEAEISRLNPKNIYIVGGERFISQTIENKLARKYKTIRIDGDNRYDTAVNISKRVVDSTTKSILVVSGDTFSDALSAGAYAAKSKVPILYTNSKNLDRTTKNYLKSLNRKINYIVVGGKKSINDTVLSELQSINSGNTIQRIKGSDRYATSLAFAEEYFSSSKNIIIASGLKFPDALAGGPFAGYKDAPILLVNNDIDKGSREFIYKNESTTIYLLGGKATLAPNIENNLSSIVQDIYDKNTAKPEPEKPVVPPNSNKIKIMLDPGHGKGQNRGFVNVDPKNNGQYCNEGDNTYFLAHKLKSELERYGFEVGITRTSISQDPSLETRGKMARGYDLFISVHSNAAGSTVRGTEVWDSVKKPNKALASKISRYVSAAFGHTNRGVKYRVYPDTVNTDYYAVLRSNEATHGMLVEHGFHTNYQDASILFYQRQKIAEMEAKAIAEYYGKR